MSMQSKFVIIFLIIVILSILSTFLISHFVVAESFEKLEENYTERSVRQVKNNLSKRIDTLMDQNDDWASWDDTYEFVDTVSTRYIDSNLVEGTFSSMNIDFMIFLDEEGKILYEKAVDRYYDRVIDEFVEKETALPSDIYDHFGAGNILSTHMDEESRAGGILELKDSMAIISSEPIITSEEEGPVKGSLIMGRFITESEINELSSQFFYNVGLFSLNSEDPAEPVEEFLKSPESAFGVAVIPQNQDNISGYMVLEDIYGNPSLLLKVDIVRDIYNQGQNTELITIFIVSVLILIFSVLVFFIINKFLLARLENISTAVKDLGLLRDFKKRISIAGNDELSSLSSSINIMLDELDVAQNEVKQSEKRYRSLFENSLDGIYISTAAGDYIDANPALVEMLGYGSREELLSINIPTQLYCHEKDRPRLEDRDRIFQTCLRKKDSTEIFVEISSKVIHNRGGTVFYQGIVRDITQRKKAEEKIRLLSFHDDLTGLYNRAYFKEELERLDTGRQLPLSLIIADVNCLKLINDAFGHRNGDKLLKICSRVFEECCRKEDIIARWGGDEFIILLPLTNKKNAFKMIDRIKKVCSTHRIKDIPISISMGVETKTDSGEDINGILKDAEDMMYRRKLLERKSISSAIISSLEKTLWENTHETKEHAGRIREIAVRMGKAVGLPQNELNGLVLLSSLHDLGKIAIGEDILNKKGKLTKKDWQIIRRHPEIGYNIAQSTPRLSGIAEAILGHHERWDGKGYPQGLKGNQIPIISRIISIADAYDVMTGGRPYKEPISKDAAVEEIKKGSGRAFDPELASKFLEIISGND